MPVSPEPRRRLISRLSAASSAVWPVATCSPPAAGPVPRGTGTGRASPLPLQRGAAWSGRRGRPWRDRGGKMQPGGQLLHVLRLGLGLGATEHVVQVSDVKTDPSSIAEAAAGCPEERPSPARPRPRPARRPGGSASWSPRSGAPAPRLTRESGFNAGRLSSSHEQAQPSLPGGSAGRPVHRQPPRRERR